MPKPIALSKRDKNLIYGCALFATAAITYMTVISPLTEEITMLTDERDMNQVTVDNVYSEAGLADSYQSWYEDSDAEYKEMLKQFDLFTYSEDIDEYFTQKIEEYSLTPLSLEITKNSGSQQFLPFDYDSGESEAPEYSSYIDSYEIALSCSGEYRNVLFLLDYFNDYSCILMETVDLGEADLANPASQTTARMQLTLYTYNRNGFETSSADQEEDN